MPKSPIFTFTKNILTTADSPSGLDVCDDPGGLPLGDVVDLVARDVALLDVAVGGDVAQLERVALLVEVDAGAVADGLPVVVAAQPVGEMALVALFLHWKIGKIFFIK